MIILYTIFVKKSIGIIIKVNMIKDEKARKIIKKLTFRCRCEEEIRFFETKFHYRKCYLLEFNQIKQSTNNSQTIITIERNEEKKLNKNNEEKELNKNNEKKKLNENNEKKTITNKNNEKTTIANKNDEEKELNENDKKTTIGNENNEKKNPNGKTKLNIIDESNVGSNGETNRHLNERNDGGVEGEENGIKSFKKKRREKGKFRNY